MHVTRINCRAGFRATFFPAFVAPTARAQLLFSKDIMADSSSSAASSGPSKPQAPPKPQNPVFKMMGMFSAPGYSEQTTDTSDIRVAEHAFQTSVS